MKINEVYNANDKVWFSGKPIKTNKFYKPTIHNQMFFTTNPEYALKYMTTGYDDEKNSCCIVATMNNFKLKIFDFTDKNHIQKLEYPKGIEKILLSDSFWQSIEIMYEDCYEYKEADEESILWFQEKFKDLLKQDAQPVTSYRNEDLYEYQAVILNDIANLPDKFTAYYNWDYDDASSGGESISLFNVDGIDKVVPTVLTFDDTQNLVDAINNKEINIDNLSEIIDFIEACTGVRV